MIKVQHFTSSPTQYNQTEDEIDTIGLMVDQLPPNSVNSHTYVLQRK